MDALGLLSNDWLSLRDVSRLLLLSGLFTAAALLAFPRNAPTRRALLLAAVTALTVIPFLLAQSGTWTLELEQLPSSYVTRSCFFKPSRRSGHLLCKCSIYDLNNTILRCISRRSVPFMLCWMRIGRRGMLAST